MEDRDDCNGVCMCVLLDRKAEADHLSRSNTHTISAGHEIRAAHYVQQLRNNMMYCKNPVNLILLLTYEDIIEISQRYGCCKLCIYYSKVAVSYVLMEE